MNPRSKKTYETGNVKNADKKGSVSKAGYNEQNEKTVKHSEKNPAPSKSQDRPGSSAKAGQDDTGGGNNTGKKIHDL